MSDLDTIISRLGSPAASARRIAVLDLIRMSAVESRATTALLDHLPNETDEKAALAIIRHLERSEHQPARPVLWQLYQNPATPVRIAHAAVVAHDCLLGLARVSGADPLQWPRGDHPDDAKP